MKKIDFKKEMKSVFHASNKKFSVVEIPDMNYLMVDGKGLPGNKEFEEAMGAIYGTAYTLKFMLKDEALQPEGYHDFVIPPLEGYYDSENKEFDIEKPETWSWTMMVMQPDWITKDLVEKVIGEIKAKKETSGIEKLRYEKVKGGKAVQIMHIGPYDQVGEIYEKIKTEITNMGVQLIDDCREVYISDPRRTAPEKLKTVVRMYFE